MDISLNIILDSISHYRYEAYIDLPSDIIFRRVSILLRDVKDTKNDCLYVCRLSDALKAGDQKPGLFYICLRDRIHDGRETKENLSGMIIINENLELDQLFSEIQDTFVLVNDWYQNMQDAVIRQKTMQDIITMSEPVIGNFITVTDTAFSLLAYTKNLQTDDPMQSALVQNGFHTEEFIKVFKRLKRFDVWMNADDLIINTEGNVCKYDTVSKVFVFNETYFTHVVMICDHRRMTAGLIDLYRYLIDMLSFYIKRNWEEVKNFDHVYSSLVLDLMQNKVFDKEAVRERAKFIGIRPLDQFIVMLLSDGSGIDSIPPGLIALDISKMFSRIRPIHFNCRLMLFLHHPDIASFMAEQDMYSKLNGYFQKYGIFCGISDIFYDLPDISQAYHQAELALVKSDPVHQKGHVVWEDTPHWSNIASFDTYYASFLLDRSEEAVMLWKGSKYGKMLLELYRSDKEKNTNNLDILYTFLMNERRTTETAAYLHMHRNNVVYRISRIEELLKVSLDDRLTRLNLSMTFQMLKNSGCIDDYGFHESAEQTAGMI